MACSPDPCPPLKNCADQKCGQCGACQDAVIASWKTNTEDVAQRQSKVAQAIPQYDDFSKRSLSAALAILGVRVRWNLRGQHVEVQAGQTPWMRLNDRDEHWLRDTLAERFRKRVAKSKQGVAFWFSEARWRVSLGAILKDHEVDPFKLWLKDLPEWDGQPRMRTLLSGLLGAEDTPQNRWASAHLFCGPVLRTIEPGAKLDQMVVLIGPQGVGKSHLLSAILPEDGRRQYFSDSLDLGDRTKERAEALQGRVIVEVAELAGATRADLESLKAFITRVDDGGVRMAYARHPEPMPRRCILVGTTNSDNCLPNDVSGLRRFLPVQLGADGCDISAAIRPIREQLWAEAADWYRTRDSEDDGQLPRSLHGVAAEQAERHRSRDAVVEDALIDFLSRANGVPKTLAEIASESGIAQSGNTLTVSEQKRIGAALIGLGFTKSRLRRNGRRLSVWQAPNE